MVLEWNPQLAKASWCQRKRCHQLAYNADTLLYGSGVIIEVTK